MEAERKAVAHFDGLAKQEQPIPVMDGLQVIRLPALEKQKFLRIGYDEGGKDSIRKSPKTGPELKKLLTRGR